MSALIPLTRGTMCFWLQSSSLLGHCLAAVLGQTLRGGVSLYTLFNISLSAQAAAVALSLLLPSSTNHASPRGRPRRSAPTTTRALGAGCTPGAQDAESGQSLRGCCNSGSEGELGCCATALDQREELEGTDVDSFEAKSKQLVGDGGFATPFTIARDVAHILQKCPNVARCGL